MRKPTPSLLAAPLVLLAMSAFGNVGCAATEADQGTSSGWTDAQGMDDDVNFYASGYPTDAELVEGDDVPAGRIVLDDSTITINVTIGTDGQAEATRGDADSNNTPTVDTDVSGVPGVPGVGELPEDDDGREGLFSAAWFNEMLARSNST